MPRPLRIEFPGAWYHVMNRGSGYQTIYHTIKQRQLFLDLLSDVHDIYSIETHAYCLMDNHYHLLLHTPKGNLGRAMRHINGVYTQRYNRLEKTDGPLFRGRYKAILVDKENYLLQVSRYIHLNPVAAKLSEYPSDYQWSSYPYYVNKIKKPSWLIIREILNSVGQRNKKNCYQQYVEQGIDDEMEKFYEKKNRPMILGDEKYKKQHLEQVDDEQIAATSSDYNRTYEPPSIDNILKCTARQLNTDIEDLLRYRRGYPNEPKLLAVYACRKIGAYKLSVIAKKFSFNSCGTVSKIVTLVDRRLQENRTMKRLYEEINKMVEGL